MNDQNNPRSERAIRKKLVDPKLEDAGWRAVPFNPNRELTTYDRDAIEEFPTNAGPADYALCVQGRILGVVEAKNSRWDPRMPSRRRSDIRGALPRAR